MERVGNRSLASQQFVIVGAGWAGISTALSLLRLGVPPVHIRLIERTPHGGGRAFSFRDKTTGLELDNGQHVLLGCCTEFIRLLREANFEHAVTFQPQLRVPVYSKGQRYDIVSRQLPGALHLFPGILKYGHLTPAQRLRTFAVARRLLHPQSPASDHVSFATWLRQLGQSDKVIDEFWDLLGTAVLNGHAGDMSARLATEAFRMGVVAGASQARLGLFQVPLGRLASGILEALEATGVQVQMSSPVDQLDCDGQSVTGVRLRSGDSYAADVVISTVPHDAFLRMLPDAWQTHPFVRQFADFRWSPILNLYLLYDNSVLDEDVVASTAAGGMFIFNRGRLIDCEKLDGRWLSVSISAADRYRKMGRDDVERLVVDAIETVCPRARSANVLNISTVWQPLATFLATPGTWDKRPSAKTPFPGLVLAGDWTNTGWPACLEGAVRSGQTAASEAVHNKVV